MGKSISMIRDAIKSRNLKMKDFAEMVGKTEVALGVQLRKDPEKEIPFQTFVEYADLLDYDVILVDRHTGNELNADIKSTQPSYRLVITIERDGEKKTINL